MTWKIHLRPSWQEPGADPEVVTVQDVKQVFDGYPKIRLQFARDLRELGKQDKRYLLEMSVDKLQVEGHEEDIDAENWIFVWAVDFRGRVFHLLFERENTTILLVGAGPAPLVQFLHEMQQEAIPPTLGLLTQPDKVRSVVVFLSRTKPSAYKVAEMYRKYAQVQSKINQLKMMPNVEGQWFPSFAPKCPVCGNPLVGLDNYQVGFKQMVCPRCGYKKQV